MGDLSSKKRKSSQDVSSQAKKKKVGFDTKSAAGALRSLEVSKLVKPQAAPPVVAFTPGLTLPKSVEFRPYDKVESSKRKKNAPPPEMVLHSTSHQSLEYTGREDRPKGSEPFLRHFIGVFDPRTGKVEVVESKRMVVRGTVRSHKASDDAMAGRSVKQTRFDMRIELGEAFGTRKAKKALKSVTENALAERGAPGKLATGELALMDSIKGATRNMSTREELQAAVDEARPVPRGNYDADEIQDVYVPAEIIGAEVLNAIPVLEWQEKVKAQEAVSVPSRFVAHRITRVAHNENAVQRLKVMRYLLWVIIFWATTKQGKERGTRMIGKRDVLRISMAGAPDIVIESIRRKFSDNGVMRKTHVDLLMTHCCVFASIIDNFEVNTFDLREDLKLEQKQLSQYFLEVGARMTQSKKGDKIEHIAKLVLPLQFPKIRQIRQRR